MEIAAAGGHNIILVGPPDVGKTMLAKHLGFNPILLLELKALKIQYLQGFPNKLDANISCLKLSKKKNIMQPNDNPHTPLSLILPLKLFIKNLKMVIIPKKL